MRGVFALSPDYQVASSKQFLIAKRVKMISNLTTAISSLAGFYVFFWALLKLTQDANEPPVVENTIPFLSSIISMVSKGSEFHNYLR